MENFATKQEKSAAEFYQNMGVSPKDFLEGESVKDVFEFLNFEPLVDENGNRALTPYEILGLLPNMDGNIEKPIVFFVKNKIKNLSGFKSSAGFDFVFSKEKNQHKDKLIEFVLTCYKAALAENNMAEAEKQFAILNKITNGKAKHYVGACYDYKKFYKQMKKQLLIDLFSHFFMLYLIQKKSIIKKGLIIKNKKFVPFNQNKQQQKQEEVPVIKSIKIDRVSEKLKEETEKPAAKETKNEIVKETQTIITEIENTQEKQEIEQDLPVRESFIKRIKHKFFRKDKKKINAFALPAENQEESKPEIEKEVVYE